MGFIDFCFQRETAYCMFDFLPVICSRQYVILGRDKQVILGRDKQNI